ncbi:MAG: acylneuraminate cytidylyltransferase family protein [Sphingomonadales bacterium]|nr:acylneuraminate cytidylyltransferase family protein [Sphingomonadales bacterium]
MSFQGKEVIGLVPARGGSKGIPRKNLIDFQGVPLIAHTLRAAHEARDIDRVIVSSDDPEILDVGHRHGAEPLLRPEEFAADDAPSHGLIRHAIQELGHAGEDAWYVLLQPTSPLRTGVHIDAAFRQLGQSGACGVISVVAPEEHPMKAFVVDEDGYLVGLWGDDGPFQPRQSLPEACFANGAIYIFSSFDFLAEGRIPVKEIVPYLMDARASVDVDTLADLERASLYARVSGHA